MNWFYLFLGSEISEDISGDDDRTYEPSQKKTRGNYADYADYRYVLISHYT